MITTTADTTLRRYSLTTPTGRVRHWILVDGRADMHWHGPNAYTTEGMITRTTAATMLRAWRQLQRKGRYQIRVAVES